MARTRPIRPCAPSFRSTARHPAQSPCPNVSVHRLAPSVSAATARTSPRGVRPVTARAATAGSAAAVKKPPSALRRASVAATERSTSGGIRSSRSSSTAVTAPPGACRSSTESERTRCSTYRESQRTTTTVACGVRT